jgi:hypothetical protein
MSPDYSDVKHPRLPRIIAFLVMTLIGLAAGCGIGLLAKFLWKLL